MTTYGNQHYLLIRPVAFYMEDLDDYVEELCKITGLTKLIAKQKLTGSSLQSLKISTDTEVLKSMSAKLKEAGILSVILSKSELKNASKNVVNLKSLAVEGNTINFYDNSGDLALSVNTKTSMIVVAGTPNINRIKSKRLTRAVYDNHNPIGPMELLKLMIMNKPAIDFYSDKSDKTYRINSSTGFNYNSLGDKLSPSASVNIQTIISLLKSHSGNMLLDTAFGETSLPFINNFNEEDQSSFQKEFATYSRLVYLATKKGTFKNVKTKGIMSTLMAVEELGDGLTGALFWAGPLFLKRPGVSEDGKTEKQPEFTNEMINSATEIKTPYKFLPPPGAVTYNVSRPSTWLSGTKAMYLRHHSTFKSLGPFWLFYPLLLVTLFGFYLFSITDFYQGLFISCLSGGLMIYIHSFVLAMRKRTIENCPTSNIKTMAMGEVEVQGIARAKHHFTAPYSGLKCVYYEYKYYDYVHGKNGRERRLKEWGMSGETPFYIEQDGAMVTVNPRGALIHSGRTETHRGNTVNMFLSSTHRNRNSDSYAVETIIPVGTQLYIMGHASRRLISTVEKKKQYLDRLRELKTDKSRMSAFDEDLDGKISAEEWDKAKGAVREAMYLESLKGVDIRDEIIISENPIGGLFYIADKEEEHLLASLSWRIPTFLVTGTVLIITGAIWWKYLFYNQIFWRAVKNIFNIS